MMTMDQALAHIRIVLEEQLARAGKMSSEKSAQSGKDALTIGIIDGDGIGPIIMEQAVSVLRQLLCRELDSGKIVLSHIEGLTLENRLAQGQSIPPEVMEKIKACDVLLKGPTTTPKGGSMESANVVLRRELDLYANVRPVSIPEEGIDWVFFRENTEGEYALGSSGVELPGLALDLKVTTDAGTARIARAAFEYAKNNGKNTVSIVTKANIMKKTDGKFSEICHTVAEAYPQITAEDWYVDIMAANLVNESIRKNFQVFLLPNLYGDILTDEAAQLQGGVGTAGSANIGENYAMFEAVHGSAPRLIEQGLGQYADPRSILRAVSMLLRHIGKQHAALRLEEAMEQCTLLPGAENGVTCREYTQHLLAQLVAGNSK